MNRKIWTLQLTAFLFFSGCLTGMFVYTDVYEEIHETIVTTLCLSCIKMDPKTTLDYTFTTANNEPHPEFILDNLTKGPIFLAFRNDACPACDTMEPLIQEIFNVWFEPEDLVYETIIYKGSPITLIHINLDHATGDLKESFAVYDKDHRRGVPMFVAITLGNNSGHIEPSYTTAYGTLGVGSTEGRRAVIRKMIVGALTRYDQNSQGYTPK